MSVPEKNAPVSMFDIPEVRATFERDLDFDPEDDGLVSAGYQPLDPRLQPSPSLRPSAAKLIALARRELNQTPEQTASAAGVELSDLQAMERGESVAQDKLVRVARVLNLDAEALVRMFVA